MSSFSTGIGMLALAAIGMVGYQAAKNPLTNQTQSIPSDPVVAVALPGIAALPARIAMEPAPARVMPPDEDIGSGITCGASIRAEARPPAMIALSFSDPCRPGTSLIARHDTLALSTITDAAGRAELLVPAFSTPARIIVEIAPTDPIGLTVDIPDLADFHRAAIAWEGGEIFRLEAHERSATDGSAGHIRSDNPGSVADVILGIGGYLSQHGHGPDSLRAQVYTYPRDTLDGPGWVRLSATLAQEACGSDATAQSLQIDGAQELVEIAVTVTAPDCGPEIRELVLQNLFHDMRIARQ